MPYPKSGESKKDYIARFMKSSEAQADYPEEKQRLAVAYSMYSRENSAQDYGVEHPWPMQFSCNFIEPGVVHYGDLGPCKVCGDEMRCGEGMCQNEGEIVLVKQEALAAMAKSFIGKPVIDFQHEDVIPSTVADGEADGIVTEVWLDDKSGWWKCRFLVWSPEAQKHCLSKTWSVSCAYNPTDVGPGGTYHNMEYQEEVLNGVYTHLALVQNPRYSGATIELVNSKGDKMSWKFWEKGARKNAAPADLEQLIDVEGKQIPLKALLEAVKKAEAAKPAMSDDTVLEHEGKEWTLGKLKENYANVVKRDAQGNVASANKGTPKRNADAGDGLCPECKGSGKAVTSPIAGASTADAGHGEHTEGMANAEEATAEDPKKGHPTDGGMPDLRNPKAPSPMEAKEAKGKDGDGSDGDPEAAAKDAEAADKEKQALELQQAADDKKTADAAEADEVEAAQEKRNAGRKSFAALRNAASERMGEPVTATLENMDIRVKRGSERYGRKD